MQWTPVTVREHLVLAAVESTVRVNRIGKRRPFTFAELMDVVRSSHQMVDESFADRRDDPLA
jgi:hypothetical protein